MNSITNNTTRMAVAALAAFALIAVSAVIAVAPKAHAADLGFDDYSGGGGYDYGDQYSGGYGYSDQYSGGLGYTDQYYGGNGYDSASNYYDQYSGGNPSYDYGSGYSGCSSCGGGFSGGGFGGSGFSGMGGFGGGSSSTFAPTTVSNNVPTTIYSPTNTSVCTAPNSCNSSVDDHSIFNAPTTVTISNPTPAQTQTQVVYQQVPVYQQPNYPVYNQTPCCYQQPVVYPVTRQPYVSLNQVPYTGLDLGPVGTVVYWGFLVLWCLVAAYLIVYKRVQTKVVSGLNNFLFGPKVGTHAKVVMPAVSHSTHTKTSAAYVAPVAKNDDAIDPFIASQIARNK